MSNDADQVGPASHRSENRNLAKPAWLAFGHQRINQMDRTALDVASEATKLAEDQRQTLLDYVREQTSAQATGEHQEVRHAG